MTSWTSQGYVESAGTVAWTGSDGPGDPVFKFAYEVTDDYTVTISNKGQNITAGVASIKDVQEDNFIASGEQVQGRKSFTLHPGTCVRVEAHEGEYSYTAYIVPLLNSFFFS